MPSISNLFADEEPREFPFIAFYNGKKIEVYAETSYKAQTLAASMFKARKQHEVDVYRADLPISHASL